MIDNEKIEEWIELFIDNGGDLEEVYWQNNLKSFIKNLLLSKEEEVVGKIKKELEIATMTDWDNERILTDKEAKKYTKYDASIWVFKGDIFPRIKKALEKVKEVVKGE